MPSMMFLTESAVTVLPETDETVHSLPLPSPKSILPKLKEEDLMSPSISALSRLTKAPALFSEARTALSLISTVVFEGGDELLVIIARGGGEFPLLRAGAHAAVDAVLRQSAHFLAPDVCRALFDLREQGVDGRIQLFGNDAEIEAF